MESKSKYQATREEIEKAFAAANLGIVKSYEPLGEGMFNAAYKVVTDKGEYVIKIAPENQDAVMTYEQNMLKMEVFWYKEMAAKTAVPVPKIYYEDHTMSIMRSAYFIMDLVDGTQLDKLKRNDDEKALCSKKLCGQIADIHNIEGDGYGYVQNGLHEKWSDAVRSMYENCVKDLNKYNKKSTKIPELIRYCDMFKDILDKAPCTLVNYDFWDSNIIAKKLDGGDIRMTWIDPERGFYGDPLWDFICLDIMKMTLEGKSGVIEEYNKTAKIKAEVNDETEIRYAFALGYMGAIQETEKYFRFKPMSEGWMFDIISSPMYYRSALKTLKKYEKQFGRK